MCTQKPGPEDLAVIERSPGCTQCSFNYDKCKM